MLVSSDHLRKDWALRVVGQGYAQEVEQEEEDHHVCLYWGVSCGQAQQVGEHPREHSEYPWSQQPCYASFLNKKDFSLIIASSFWVGEISQEEK